jgi:hypothetical protein
VDLALYGRVLRRFWPLVATGVILASALAILSLVRVTSHGLVYRKPMVWQSQALLLLTEPGFPWGRTVIPAPSTGGSGNSVPPQSVNVSGLTDLYSQFANSDDVRRLMRDEGAPATWSITAAPAVPTIQGAALPVIALAGRANSANGAVSAVEYGRRALVEYVKRQQQAAKIPTDQRITLQTVQGATSPVVVEPRKKTLAVVVFLAVVVATLGLAFILENLRPRVRAVAPAAPLLDHGDSVEPTLGAASKKHTA